MTNRSRQSGSALLAMVIIFLAASSYVLLTKLNANSRDYSRRSSNFAVLNEAKAALIGYAVNYPLDHPGRGPGHLPCPDINNDGSAGSSCSVAGGTSIGRIPWNTAKIRLENLRDSSGETLWYAIADNYRSNAATGPNSDTPGNFSVDGNGDIVAVIFAPGAPVASQNRSGAGLLDVSNYLEDDNANGDNSFVSKATGEFNDTLVTISRQELMSVVEKRVLGDVSETLTNYQTSYNAFPWLSPFSDPSTSTFKSTVGTFQGHLPYHYSGDAAGASNRNPFTTDITISWSNITNANTNLTDDTIGVTLPAPTTSCSLNSLCSNGSDPFDGIVPDVLTITDATCIWSDKDTFNCQGIYTEPTTPLETYWEYGNVYGYKNNTGYNWVQFWTNTSGSYAWTWGYFDSSDSGRSGWGTYNINKVMQGTVTRVYDFDIEFVDIDGININPPDSSNVRTRDLDISGLLSTANVSITVTDTLSVSAQYPNYGVSTKESVTTVTGDSDTTGTIATTGIQYDLDVDDNELPSWFVKNGWQNLIYVAYASGEPLPGDTSAGQDCVTLGTTCITVNIDGTVNNNVRAVVLSAGVDLTSGTARPNGTLTDYFEDENSNPVDDSFVKNKITTTYNDQTRIISTAP